LFKDKEGSLMSKWWVGYNIVFKEAGEKNRYCMLEMSGLNFSEQEAREKIAEFYSGKRVKEIKITQWWKNERVIEKAKELILQFSPKAKDLKPEEIRFRIVRAD